MSQLTEQNKNELNHNISDSKQNEANTSPQSNPLQNEQQFRFKQEEVNQDADYTSNANTANQNNGNDTENGQYHNSYSHPNNSQNNPNNGPQGPGYNSNPGYQQNQPGNQGYNNPRYNQPYQGHDNWQQQNGYNNNQMNGENNQRNPFDLKDTPFGLLQNQKKIPKIKTDDEARNLYYGVNVPYYQNVFKKYKQGQKANWNWCAFFFQSYWFFSRKMYVIGSLYAAALSFISIAVMQIYDNMDNPNISLMILPWAVVFFALWIAGGLFGNYVYMTHMENKIIYPSENKDSNEKMVQLNVMRGGFSIYGVLLCIVATDLIATIIQSLFGLIQ